MEYYVWQLCPGAKFFKRFQKNSAFTGTSILKSYNKIEILIFIAEKFFQLILMFFPVSQWYIRL